MATKEIYLAGGCFWGMQGYLQKLPGIVETQVGYANGITDSPTYKQVCAGGTHHAETVRVAYDPAIISLSLLLAAYLDAIDPTSVNKQGEDEGEQYRTGIWWTDDADAAVVAASLKAVAAALPAGSMPVAVQSGPLTCFWPAEDYHQDYLAKNPCGYCHLDLGDADRFVAANEAKFGRPALRLVHADNDLPDAARQIRHEVFQVEQGYENEFDDIDFEAVHVVLLDGTTPLGCCRAYESREDNDAEGTWLLGRLAVLPSYRGHHYGPKIVAHAEKIARERGAKQMRLHAQTHAVPMYESCGYVAVSDIDLEDEGEPHRWMAREL